MAEPRPSGEAERVENLIVGGGISGLACALRLHEAGIEFLLITDALGGRLQLSRTGYPLGAVMIHRDYTNVRRHVLRTKQPKRLRLLFRSFMWDGQRAVPTVRHLNVVKLLRLRPVILTFRRALNALRIQAPYVCQKELLQNFPLLRSLVSQSATDFVREHGLEDFAHRFLGRLAGAVFLSDWEQLNAFHFCVGLNFTMGGSLSVDWRNTLASLTQGYEDRILIDKVNAIAAEDDVGSYLVSSGRSRYRARRLVVSTPISASNEILAAPNDAQQVCCHVFQIAGRRRSRFMPDCSLLMGAHDEIRMFGTQSDGTDVIYAAQACPDFDRYYEHFRIIEHRAWEPAIQLSRSTWRPLQPKANLFTIGDYNICGLEDSYLTGLFAAHRIIGQTGLHAHQPSRK